MRVYVSTASAHELEQHWGDCTLLKTKNSANSTIEHLELAPTLHPPSSRSLAQPPGGSGPAAVPTLPPSILQEEPQGARIGAPIGGEAMGVILASSHPCHLSIPPLPLYSCVRWLLLEIADRQQHATCNWLYFPPASCFCRLLTGSPVSDKGCNQSINHLTPAPACHLSMSHES